jgi:hypothetical protein
MPKGPFKGRPIDWDKMCTKPGPAPTVEEIMEAARKGRELMFKIDINQDQIDIALHGAFHFVREGASLLIPRTVPLIPDPSMVDRIRVEEDGHSWVEYDEADEGWRRYFGFVRYEERPASWVRIVDITCPVTGKRTRAIYAHPEAIKNIRETERVYPQVIHSFAI